METFLFNIALFLALFKDLFADAAMDNIVCADFGASAIGMIIAAAIAAVSAGVESEAADAAAEEGRKLNARSHRTWMDEFNEKKRMNRAALAEKKKDRIIGSINGTLQNSMGLQDRMRSIWAGRGIR